MYYDENGVLVEVQQIDLEPILQNQSDLITQNILIKEKLDTIAVQQNVEILKKLDSQIEIENNIVSLLGFCFVILLASFLYKLFHSVLSF